MAFFLSPVLNEQQFDANGDPRAGALITTYLAGTLTAVTTYKTSTGTAHSNPITLDSSGNYPNGTQLWLQGGFSYKFVITDSTGANSRTYDNITGVGDDLSGIDQWVLYGAAPTYISATSFSLVGDQTNTFQVGRRLKSANTGGTVYSTVYTAVFAAGITTITVTNTSGVLDSGLSAVNYGFLSADNQSIPAVNEAVSLQTGTTYTYAKGDSGRLVSHTNAAAIAGTLPAASTVGAGWWVDIQNRGAGALTITPTTSTIDGAATLVLANKQGVRIVSDGTNYFTQRGGSSTPSNSTVRLHTANGYGAVSTAIPRFTTTVVNSTVDMTYADNANTGTTITIVNSGNYAISFSMAMGGSNYMGVSLNSSQLTTSIVSITAADRLCDTITVGAGVPGNCSVTLPLAAGDVIRPHTDGTAAANAAYANFCITRVS